MLSLVRVTMMLQLGGKMARGWTLRPGLRAASSFVGAPRPATPTTAARAHGRKVEEAAAAASPGSAGFGRRLRTVSSTRLYSTASDRGILPFNATGGAAGSAGAGGAEFLPPSAYYTDRARAMSTDRADTGGDIDVSGALSLQVSSPALLLNHMAERYVSTSRILMEFIDNSLDDAESGYRPETTSYSQPVDIRVYVSRTKRSIRIVDNCRGMPPDVLSRWVTGKLTNRPPHPTPPHATQPTTSPPTIHPTNPPPHQGW